MTIYDRISTFLSDHILSRESPSRQYSNPIGTDRTVRYLLDIRSPRGHPNIMYEICKITKNI
jgi:hypothetical protein